MKVEGTKEGSKQSAVAPGDTQELAGLKEKFQSRLSFISPM